MSSEIEYTVNAEENRLIKKNLWVLNQTINLFTKHADDMLAEFPGGGVPVYVEISEFKAILDASDVKFGR